MILNWIEGSIFLIEFAFKSFVKAMLRGSVIPKCKNLATLSMDLLGAYEKTNFIFWGFLQIFFFIFIIWLSSWN
jgi:hypothetical protein